MSGADNPDYTFSHKQQVLLSDWVEKQVSDTNLKGEINLNHKKLCILWSVFDPTISI